MPVASWSPTPASVASSGSTACVADEVQSSTPAQSAERPEEIAVAPLEALGGALVVARRAAHLGSERGLAAALEPLRVLGVHHGAHLAQEAQVAVARLAAHRLELVAEDRREPDRDRRAVEQVEQRQVHARHRLPQPLLAERPRAEALHVRHVGVEHERERAAALAHPGRRSTATKSSARSSRPVRRAKSLVEMAGVKRS